MTQAYYISGRPSGPLSSIARIAFLAVAAIGGLFMLIFSAAFALFAVAGIAVIGFIVFAFFWTKAKLTGKPFGPKAQLDAMRKDMEAQMGGQMGATTFANMQSVKPADDGVTIDAHQTPQGWSVDD